MSRDVSTSSSNVPSSTRDVSRSSSNASSSPFGASFSDSNVNVVMTSDEIAEFKEMKRKKMREAAEAQDAAELLESAQRLQIAQDQFKKRTEHRVKVEAFQADPLPGLDDEKKELVFEFFAQIELQEKNIADALKKLGYEKGGHYDWRWGGAKKPTTPFELFALQVSVQNALICSAAMDLFSKCNLTNDRTVEMNEEYQQRVTKRKLDSVHLLIRFVCDFDVRAWKMVSRLGSRNHVAAPPRMVSVLLLVALVTSRVFHAAQAVAALLFFATLCGTMKLRE